MANPISPETVHNSRILWKLGLRQDRVVFSTLQDLRCTLSLATVLALLNSQSSNSIWTTNSLNQASTQVYEDQSDGYAGLTFTNATAKWDQHALQWLLQKDTSLCPTNFVGLPNLFPSKVPQDCFSVERERERE